MRKLTVLIITLSLLLITIQPTSAIAAQKPKLNTKSIKLEVGNQFQLYMENVDWDYNNRDFNLYYVQFTSSDESIAAVDAYGLIKAKGIGTATITATLNEKKYTCKVNVKRSRYKWNTELITMTTEDEREISLNIKDEYKDYTYTVYDAETGKYNREALYLIQSWDKPYHFTIVAYNAGNYILECEVIEEQEDGSYQYYIDTVNIQVSLIGVAEKKFALAVKSEKTLTIDGCQDAVYTSSNKSVAVVNRDGKITAKSTGEAIITTSAKLLNGEERVYETQVIVTNPKVIYHNQYNWAGEYITYEIQGHDEWLSDVTIELSDASIIEIYNKRLYAKDKGKSTITITIDGKAFTKSLRVYKPSTKESYLLSVGKSEQIKITGLPKDMEPLKFTLSKKGIAEISDTGVITAKKKGSAILTIEFETNSFSCNLNVGHEKAVKAIKEGIAVIGTPYSQEKRMKEGYFDCSSFVWYVYHKAGINLGSSTYAPTAANIAKHLVDKNKVVAYESIDPSKLQLGDLIFYGGAENGRYLGISHVAIFEGTVSYYSWWGEEYSGSIIEAASGGVNRGYYSGGESSVVLIARPTK